MGLPQEVTCERGGRRIAEIAGQTYIWGIENVLKSNLLDTKHKLGYVLCILVRPTGHPVNTAHNQNLRTTRGPMAGLLIALYDSGKTIFTIADAVRVTRLSPALASSLLYKAAKRGLVSRLKRGLFVIVPPELGSSAEYFGNPYLVASHLAGSAPYFISHSSAMELHRMVTQPQFVIFVSSTKRLPKQTLHGTEFQFVYLKGTHFFGTMKHWVTKDQAVEVGDLERTILDGLRQPEYCGGITEVAKGLWMRRADIRPPKLVEYAACFKSGAITRRLGYLLELLGVGTEVELNSLRKSLTATYVPLDPILPREGPHFAKWRLQINVSPEELRAVRSA
jgi:predicted transcriptional regulator of viral defense system